MDRVFPLFLIVWRNWTLSCRPPSGSVWLLLHFPNRSINPQDAWERDAIIKNAVSQRSTSLARLVPAAALLRRARHTAAPQPAGNR